MNCNILINTKAEIDSEYNVNITLTKEADKILGKILRDFLEIELIGGQISIGENNVVYRCNIVDEFKMNIMKQALLKTYVTIGDAPDNQTLN